MEALYGGAAGGGKTDTLLMAAAQYVHVPGYSALLLRRTYPDLMLPNAILDRAKQWWIPKGVPWNDRDKRFTFPTGANITFGYLDNENDKYRYQGAELQFLGVDELTQWPESWYRYLLSRLRRQSGVRVPLRARASSNPGGIGHYWVKRRFVDEEGRRTYNTEFVPSTLEDNPHIDRKEYELSLDRLDPILRQQLRHGIWVQDGGGLVYGSFDEDRNLIDAAPNDMDFLLLGLDFGIVDENALTVVGWRANDPCIYVLESYRFKGDVHDMADEVEKLEDKYHFSQIVGDTGGLGKAFSEELQGRRRVPVEAAEKTNKLGFIRLLNADLAKGRIQIVKDTCADLLDEWRELPWNDTRTKECEGFNNHAADSMLYVWRACSAYNEQAARPEPVAGTPEYYAKQEASMLQALERAQERKYSDEPWMQEDET